jgi:hypothetical protein
VQEEIRRKIKLEISFKFLLTEAVRGLIVVRVREGLAKAKRYGTKTGRPSAGRRA